MASQLARFLAEQDLERFVREEHGNRAAAARAKAASGEACMRNAPKAALKWLGRAVRNRHRHAIEQASRRWRGGRRDDSARTRRKILGRLLLICGLRRTRGVSRYVRWNQPAACRTSRSARLALRRALLPEAEEPLRPGDDDLVHKTSGGEGRRAGSLSGRERATRNWNTRSSARANCRKRRRWVSDGPARVQKNASEQVRRSKKFAVVAYPQVRTERASTRLRPSPSTDRKRSRQNRPGATTGA